MSYLTDQYREASRARKELPAVPGQMMDDVLNQATVQRRTLLRGGFGATLAAAFGSSALLTACGGGDDAAPAAPAPTPEAVNYDVTFKSVIASVGDQVVVPEGYVAELLFSAGDAVVAGATAFTGSFLTAAEYEKIAGGNHDGMHLYTIDGVDPNLGGLLAINHEAPDMRVLFAGGTFPNPPTADDVKIRLSSVGVSVVEIQSVNGKWSVKADSSYNKRYTGNTVFQVGGPAASAVGSTVVGTLNNCASGRTPWGTYLTCEETTDNYLDPTQLEVGYGWVVEIDPQGVFPATKRTAMGRFDHENTDYMMDADGTLAIYMGDDSTPGCVYKFVPSAKVNATNRSANQNLLDNGTLYAAKFNADGTGQWLELTQGLNGLVAGAQDPGNFTQFVDGSAPVPVTIDFNTQADVLINTKAAARVAGATLMDRPEWVSVGPDRQIYCTFTNNGSRKITDAANPRVTNSHGHILRWKETSNSAKATTFNWEVFLLAGDPRLTADNLKGNINGDTFSSPDGLGVDPQGRLWVQTDASTSSGTTNTFGNNAMYHVDQITKASSRFLVGPNGCEITGLTWTPDLKTFFINIQHPTGTWPSNVQGNTLPARSSTVVVRRTDGKPVGA